MNRMFFFIPVLAVAAAAAAQQGGRESFVVQQTYAELKRISGQVDVLQSNIDDLSARISRLEKGGDADALRSRIAALEGTVAQLRKDLQSQRGEIVKDLSSRIANIQPPPAPRQTKKTVVVGPHREYTVVSGDTLSLIAQAFGTTVPKIREMNALKGDNLRIGQVIKVPLEK